MAASEKIPITFMMSCGPNYKTGQGPFAKSVPGLVDNTADAIAVVLDTGDLAFEGSIILDKAEGTARATLEARDARRDHSRVELRQTRTAAGGESVELRGRMFGNLNVPVRDCRADLATTDGSPLPLRAAAEKATSSPPSQRLSNRQVEGAAAATEAERQRKILPFAPETPAAPGVTADAIAKAEAEARARRQADLADKFSAGDIRGLIASGSARPISPAPPLRMTPEAREAMALSLRSQLHACWKTPASFRSYTGPNPSIELHLNRDGSLAAPPKLLNLISDPDYIRVAGNALEMVKSCAAPFKLPSDVQNFYGEWKVIVVNFDPHGLT